MVGEYHFRDLPPIKCYERDDMGRFVRTYWKQSGIDNVAILVGKVLKDGAKRISIEKEDRYFRVEFYG